VDHERRTPNSCAHLAEVLAAREADAAGGVRERLGRRVEPPANRVLDLLGRVRLVEALGGEELEEVAVVPLPIEAVVLRPPLVTVERLVERHVALGVAGGQSNCGCDVDDPVHPLGMVGGDDRPPQGAARQRRQGRPFGAGRVHHRERILRELIGAVRLGADRSIRATVAPPVERDDPAVAGEIRDL
jgi:hypothetical protein